MVRRLILIAILLGGASLNGCSSLGVSEPSPVYGGILPHHLLVEKEIDAFYKTLENPNIDRIIVISPNHFNYGYNAIRTTDETLGAGGVAALETKNFELEHGITVHETFIKKYFPKASVTPVIIKFGTEQTRLDRLVDQIVRMDLTHTLILASIDFTHMDPESIAVKNDERTLSWLNQISEKPILLEEVRQLAKTTNPEPAWDSVAMDSPESLYVLVRVMQAKGATSFKKWARTSSASLIPGLDPSQNTSHIFGTFTGKMFPAPDPYSVGSYKPKS